LGHACLTSRSLLGEYLSDTQASAGCVYDSDRHAQSKPQVLSDSMSAVAQVHRTGTKAATTMLVGRTRVECDNCHRYLTSPALGSLWMSVLQQPAAEAFQYLPFKGMASVTLALWQMWHASKPLRRSPMLHVAIYLALLLLRLALRTSTKFILLTVQITQ
jgi:hypothetical protein